MRPDMGRLNNNWTDIVGAHIPRPIASVADAGGEKGAPTLSLHLFLKDRMEAFFPGVLDLLSHVVK